MGKSTVVQQLWRCEFKSVYSSKIWAWPFMFLTVAWVRGRERWILKAHKLISLADTETVRWEILPLGNSVERSRGTHSGLLQLSEFGLQSSGGAQQRAMAAVYVGARGWVHLKPDAERGQAAGVRLLNTPFTGTNKTFHKNYLPKGIPPVT